MRESLIAGYKTGNPFTMEAAGLPGEKAFLPCPVTGHFQVRVLSKDKSEAFCAQPLQDKVDDDGGAGKPVYSPDPINNHGETISMSRVEVQFPPLAKNTVRRNLVLTYVQEDKVIQSGEDAKDHKPETIKGEQCFPRDTAFCQVFVPKETVVNFELRDFDQFDNCESTFAATFTHPRARLTPLIPSPMAVNLLGDCNVHVTPKEKAKAVTPKHVPSDKNAKTGNDEEVKVPFDPNKLPKDGGIPPLAKVPAMPPPAHR